MKAVRIVVVVGKGISLVRWGLKRKKAVEVAPKMHRLSRNLEHKAFEPFYRWWFDRNQCARCRKGQARIFAPIAIKLGTHDLRVMMHKLHFITKARGNQRQRRKMDKNARAARFFALISMKLGTWDLQVMMHQRYLQQKKFPQAQRAEISAEGAKTDKNARRYFFNVSEHQFLEI